jgi:hypothetical protein
VPPVVREICLSASKSASNGLPPPNRPPNPEPAPPNPLYPPNCAELQASGAGLSVP